MAWFGEIVKFRQVDNSFTCIVEFYDDSTPTVRLSRTFVWPLTFTKNQVLGDIRAKGAELRNAATINSGGLVGTVVPIP